MVLDHSTPLMGTLCAWVCIFFIPYPAKAFKRARRNRRGRTGGEKNAEICFCLSRHKRDVAKNIIPLGVGII